MRRIAVILGSESDFPQCLTGLTELDKACREQTIELPRRIRISSIHRATKSTLNWLQVLSLRHPPDVLIAGAGWANHLTGICDAYLRYELGNTQTVVVGVAFADPDNDNHTLAAKLSISEVPGRQVVFGDDEGEFVGHYGFYRACRFAIEGELPPIKLPEPRSPKTFTLEEALDKARTTRH